MIKSSMDDFIENGIKNETVDMKNPNCQCCNECCSMGTLLLPGEYEALEKYFRTAEGNKLHKDAIERIKKNTTPNTMYWMCPLSNSKRRCSIYSRRPSICKKFHCSPGLMADDFDKVKEKCESGEHKMIYHLFHR